MKKGIGKIGIAATLFLLGGIIFTLVPKNEPFQTPLVFPVPGEHELLINEPGTYTLWHRVKTSYDGRQFNNSSGIIPRDVEIYLKNRETGKKVKVTNWGSAVVQVNGEAKVKLFTFPRLPKGVYVLQVFNLQTEEIFSIEQSVIAGYFEKVLMVVLALIALNAGLVLAVIGALQLAKKEQKIVTPPTLPTT